MVTKSDILKYLEDIGWTELIDSRWERQVIKDIQSGFPDITKEVIEEVLDLVLVGVRKICEESIEMSN